MSFRIACTPAEPVPRRIAVVGAAGGVGTTTVAALLVLVLRRRGTTVAVVDHGGGSLAAWLPPVGPTATTAQVLVEDRAARPVEAGRSLRDHPDADTLLLLVASSTPAALALLPTVLGDVRAGLVAPSARLHLVLSQAHGPYRPRASRLDALPGPTTLLPRDDTLAAGGLLDWPNLYRRTRTATDLLVDEL